MTDIHGKWLRAPLKLLFSDPGKAVTVDWDPRVVVVGEVVPSNVHVTFVLLLLVAKTKPTPTSSSSASTVNGICLDWPEENEPRGLIEEQNVSRRLISTQKFYQTTHSTRSSPWLSIRNASDALPLVTWKETV